MSPTLDPQTPSPARNPAPPTRRPNDEGELDRFKESISLLNYATQQHGYKIAEENPSRGTAKLQKDGETLLLSRDRNTQHDLYWNPNDSQDKGSIIDFVKSRENVSLGQVRQKLRHYLGEDGPARDAQAAAQMERPAPTKTPPAPEGLSPEESRKYYLSEALGLSPKLESRDYLHSRGITDATIEDRAFAGRVFTSTNGPYKNTAFPLYNESGMANVEQKNTNMGADGAGNQIKSRFLPLPKDGIWVSKPSQGPGLPVERIVITESGLDAMSKHQLDKSAGPVPNTLYIATGGSVTERQSALIQLQIDKHQPKQLVLANDNDAAGRRFNINYLNDLEKPRTASFTPSDVIAGGMKEFERSQPANTFHATAQGKYNTNVRIELNHTTAAEGRGLREGLALRVAELNGGEAHREHPPLRLETVRHNSQQSVMIVGAANADSPALELLARELHRDREQKLPAAERQPEGFVRVEYAQSKDWTRDVELRAQGLNPEQALAQAQLEQQQRAEQTRQKQEEGEKNAALLAQQQQQAQQLADTQSEKDRVAREETEKTRIAAEQAERDRLANEPEEIRRRQENDRQLGNLILGAAVLEVAAGEGMALGAGALVGAAEQHQARQHQVEFTLPAGSGDDQREGLAQLGRDLVARGASLEPASASADGSTRLVVNYSLDQPELPAIHQLVQGATAALPQLTSYQPEEQQQARLALVAVESQVQREEPAAPAARPAEAVQSGATEQVARQELARTVEGLLTIQEPNGPAAGTYTQQVAQALEARGATVSLQPVVMTPQDEERGVKDRYVQFAFRADAPEAPEVMKLINSLDREPGVLVERARLPQEPQPLRQDDGISTPWDEVNLTHRARLSTAELPAREVPLDTRTITFSQSTDSFEAQAQLRSALESAGIAVGPPSWAEQARQAAAPDLTPGGAKPAPEYLSSVPGPGGEINQRDLSTQHSSHNLFKIEVDPQNPNRAQLLPAPNADGALLASFHGTLGAAYNVRHPREGDAFVAIESPTQLERTSEGWRISERGVAGFSPTRQAEMAAPVLTAEPAGLPWPDHRFTATFQLSNQAAIAALNQLNDPTPQTRGRLEITTDESPERRQERQLAGEGKWVDPTEIEKRTVRGTVVLERAGDDPVQLTVYRQQLEAAGAKVEAIVPHEQRDGDPPLSHRLHLSYQAGSAEAPAITQAIREIGEQPGVTLYGDPSARYARTTFVQGAPGAEQQSEPVRQPQTEKATSGEGRGFAEPEREKAGQVLTAMLPDTEATAAPRRPKPDQELLTQDEWDRRDKRGDGTVAYKGGFLLGDFIANINKNYAEAQAERVSPPATGERQIVLSASGEDRMQVLHEAGQRLEAQGLRLGKVDATAEASATITMHYRLEQPTLPYVHQGLLDEQAAGKVQVLQAPGVEAEREREARKTGMAQFQQLTPDGPALTAEGLPNPAPAFMAANALRAEHQLPTLQQDAERQQLAREAITTQAAGDPARETTALTAYVEREALLRQAQLDSIFAPSQPARQRATEALVDMAGVTPAAIAAEVTPAGTQRELRAPEPAWDTNLAPNLQSPVRYVQVQASGDQAELAINKARQEFVEVGASVNKPEVQPGAAQLIVGYHLKQPELAAIDQKIRDVEKEPGLVVSQRVYMAFERQEHIGHQRAEKGEGHDPGQPTPPVPAERTKEQPEPQQPLPSVTPEAVAALPTPEVKTPRTVLETEEGQRATDQKAAIDAGSSQQAIIKVVEPVSRASGQGMAEKIQVTVEASGALVGDVKSTIVGENRHSEMPVTYRTDSAQIKEISNTLERAAHTPGVSVEERDDHKAGRQSAVAEVNRKEQTREVSPRITSREVGD